MPVTRIGTRGSDLALWQARNVASLLEQHHPSLRVEIVPIKTEGDRRLDVTLSELGGKGLFIKELEQALIDDRIDLAVHSMKDVTVNLESGFSIPVILKRANPFDAFVSNHYQSVSALPPNATIGTCSLRRQCQLLQTNSELNFVVLRGNVPTRLKKLDQGQFDATILAVSGLRRLGLDQRVTEVLSESPHIPSPGQGALGVECRSDDDFSQKLVAPLNHLRSFWSVRAERLANRELGGNCHVPLGILATIDHKHLHMAAALGTPDGSQFLVTQQTGEVSNYQDVARSIAKSLRDQGAQEILDAFS